MESYIILAIAWIGFYIIHSVLALNPIKSSFSKVKPYRVIYNTISMVSLLALLLYMILIPAEWILPKNIYTKFFGLVLATYAIMVLKATSKIYNWSAFLGFKREATSELKREGILAYVRHPLYLGLILLFTGYFFFSPSLKNLIAWVCTMLYLPLGIYLEEKKLVATFGDAYINYQKEVPMIIPKKNFFKGGKT